MGLVPSSLASLPSSVQSSLLRYVDIFIFYMSSVFSLVSPVISEFLENQLNLFEPSAARHFLFLQMNQSPLSDVVFHSFLWFLPWCRLNFSIAPHQIAESKVIVSPLNMLKIVKGESRF